MYSIKAFARLALADFVIAGIRYCAITFNYEGISMVFNSGAATISEVYTMPVSASPGWTFATLWFCDVTHLACR
jgi:hypothetical protein